MARLVLNDGTTYTGKTPLDVVNGLKTSSPFTANDDARKFMLNTLPMLRSSIPGRDYRIPDSIADDPDAFLRLYQTAKLGTYTPTGVGGSAKPGLPGLSGFGDAGAHAAANSNGVPTDPKRWTKRNDGLYAALADGRTYQLLHTRTGWTTAVGWDGVWTYLDQAGVERRSSHATARRMPDATAAARAAVLHAQRPVG